jgi:hypothetical protein
MIPKALREYFDEVCGSACLHRTLYEARELSTGINPVTYLQNFT